MYSVCILLGHRMTARIGGALKPLETIGTATTSEGRELALYHRDGVYNLRVDGLELMSSRARGSEETLALLGAHSLRGRNAPRVLIGGLGMGFTLRAALDALPKSATIVVAEVFEAVVMWNRGPLSHLARSPLSDPRAEVVVSDVYAHLAGSEARYDAILLDVDNGPSAFTLDANDRLYNPQGLALLKSRLNRKGLLAVWSADRDPGSSAVSRRPVSKPVARVFRPGPAPIESVTPIFLGSL